MCGILHIWCCLTVSVSRKWLYQGMRSPKFFPFLGIKLPPRDSDHAECLQVMCAKYYELRCMFYKKGILSKLEHLLGTASKFTLFSASSLKDEQLIKKQTYMKTETCKLYSRVFWIFLPNFIKIDPYNFELYCLKVCAFFWDTVYVDWSSKPTR